ncbi:fibronectin type III domain-containing protein [Leucobacter sp. OH1287]|uniref:DUF7507 domain-containing protein n=1 Tax=Leucobacter sp. OH1287 TaxID=2491049 RepID=UPI000F603143|nr:fibronectin type III domain-containing protein [Leucobacter sp. OH1287]RRD59987.1 hypothetical protein EII30_07620 [Leucobacter sp. OH1287]
MTQQKTKHFRVGAAALTALSAGLALAGLQVPIAAQATDTGSVTSVAYTPGKAQGTGKWGLIGDVETFGGNSTYPYGVGVNPQDGKLWVSDSGKMLSRWQLGNPRVFVYDQGQVPESEASSYTGNGSYEDWSADSNQGFGKFYQDTANRKVIAEPFDGDGKQHGPRGISFDSSGNSWIVDSEFSNQEGEPTERVKRFAPDATRIGGVGVSGNWQNRDIPGNYRGGYSVSVTRGADGTMLSPAEVADMLVRWDDAGNPLPSIPLDNPAVAPDAGGVHRFKPVRGNIYTDPYGVAADPVDGSLYLSLTNFRNDQKPVTPFLEKRSADGRTVTKFIGEGRFPKQEVMYGPFVNHIAGSPTYRHVFAWSQFQSAVQEFDENGEFVRQWTNGNTAAANAQDGNDKTVAVPGLVEPRGISFDERGYMYISVGGQTGRAADQRVLILGQTPQPVTSVCADRSAAGDEVKLSWECEQSPAAPGAVSDVIDYTIEMSSDGGQSWQLVQKPKSAEKTYTVTGLDPTVAYQYRVAAWNEAGNGDWKSVSVAAQDKLTADTATIEQVEGKVKKLTVNGTDQPVADPNAVSVTAAVLANDTTAAGVAITGKNVYLVSTAPDGTKQYVDQLTIAGQGKYRVVNNEIKFDADPGFLGSSKVNYVVAEPGGVKPACVAPHETSFTVVVSNKTSDASITLQKTGELNAQGTEITWTITATAQGSDPLTDVVIVDQLPGLSAINYTWPGSPNQLQPGQQLVAVATSPVTLTDQPGEVVNTAEVTAKTPTDKVVNAAATFTVKLPAAPKPQDPKPTVPVKPNQTTAPAVSDDTGSAKQQTLARTGSASEGAAPLGAAILAVAAGLLLAGAMRKKQTN